VLGSKLDAIMLSSWKLRVKFVVLYEMECEAQPSAASSKLDAIIKNKITNNFNIWNPSHLLPF
jgi:hypothetical protein